MKDKKEIIQDHISYSQIETFKCAGRYKMIYIDKSIERGSIFMTTGKVVHNAIRLYSKACIKAKCENDFELMENAIKEALKEEKTTSEQEIEIRELLLDFAEENLYYNVILDCEKEFNIKIDEGEVKGIIDRVNSYRDQQGNRILEIIDYKTSFRNYTESEVDNLLQLRIYRWAALKELYKNYDFVRLGIYNTRYQFCRFGKTVEISTLGKEVESIENFLNEQWNKIKKCSEYPFIKSEACLEYAGCPIMIVGLCPAYSKKEVERMLKSEDIIEQVQAIRKLKIQIADAIAKLKTYFITNDPIIVDGDPVGFKSNISYKYLLSGLQKLDKKYDLKLGSLEISKTAAEKIFKKTWGKDFEKYTEEIRGEIISTSTNNFEI